jgi:hypothetical protein
MKLLKPIYFSPDLTHRLLYDIELNVITLNNTITNTTLLTIPIDPKNLMF